MADVTILFFTWHVLYTFTGGCLRALRDLMMFYFGTRLQELEQPLRVQTSDKYLVKDYVRSVLGDGYTPKTLALLTDKEQLELFVFPINAVVKPSHASGLVYFTSSEEQPPVNIFSKWLSLNLYNINREINYKKISAGVIVEELVFGSKTVNDLKVFCVAGVAKLIQYDVDRHHDHKRKLYSVDWDDLNASLGYPYDKSVIEKPEALEQVLLAAEALSKPFEFVRIDFYVQGAKYLVGEITHCHGGGLERFSPPQAEKHISNILFGQG